jgi:alkanesulfonate monooxygenase SsuD/methylene tetrahydromethanopterin reductase-like flavin-dependent oxidoreductase (luciferase family)
VSGTHPIEVGLGALSAQAVPGTPEVHEALRRTVEICVAAEEEGLDSVWASEHHFADDGYLPAPLLLLAAVAARTERIRLGTNVAIAGLHHPVRLAEDAAVLDQLSGGRLLLGLGLGYREIEFAGLGLRRQSRVARLEDAVATMRSAWSGDPVPGLGLLGERAVPVTPTPAQPDGPPILLGAFAEVGVRRARRIGNGWIAPVLAHPGALTKRVRMMDLESRSEPFHIAVTLSAFVAARDAWETVRPGAARVTAQYRSWLTESGDLDLPDTSEDDKPAQFVAGSPEDCAEQLRPWWTALAALPACVVPHFALRTTFPGVAHEATLESVRLLAREVVPRLRASEQA